MGAVKIDKADKAFSEFIRTRDGWTCQRCGTYHSPNIPERRMGLHCSHFMGRGKEGTRFDEDNADALCFGCHRYFTAHPMEHYEWQLERKGQALLDKLKLQANTYHKKDRKLAYIYWTERLKEFKG